MRSDLFFLVHLCLFLAHKCVAAIDCYVCSSLEGGNRDCEDPFTKTLKTSVFIARSCDFGFFKATHCIKLKGTREDGTTILVRQCSNDNWGSHCGDIKYEIGENRETVYGCLETCDFDGCNSSIRFAANEFCMIIITVLSFLFKNWIL